MAAHAHASGARGLHTVHLVDAMHALHIEQVKLTLLIDCDLSAQNRWTFCVPCGKTSTRCIASFCLHTMLTLAADAVQSLLIRSMERSAEWCASRCNSTCT